MLKVAEFPSMDWSSHIARTLGRHLKFFIAGGVLRQGDTTRVLANGSDPLNDVRLVDVRRSGFSFR